MRNFYGRREYLLALSTAATTSVSGCSNNKTAAQTKENSASVGMPSKETDLAEEKITSVFHQLEEHPLVDGDDFVFDVTAFEADFDRRKALNRAKTAQRIVKENRDRTDIPQSRLSDLFSAAKVAELQMKQRVLVYRTIQTGRMFLQLLREPDFGSASTIIRKSKEYLGELVEMGKRIEAELDLVHGIDVPGYDYEHFQQAQQVLTEVSIWLAPTYEGFYNLALGMKQLSLANRNLEADNFGEAPEHYQKSSRYFRNSENNLDYAYGRGRVLTDFKQVADEFRCKLPMYLEFTEEMAKVFTLYNEGQKESARKKGRETLDRFRDQTRTCN